MRESTIVGADTSTEVLVGVTEARIRAAALLRRLGHAFVRHDAPDRLFEELVDAILPVVEQLETGAKRDRSMANTGGPATFTEPAVDGEQVTRDLEARHPTIVPGCRFCSGRRSRLRASGRPPP